LAGEFNYPVPSTVSMTCRLDGHTWSFLLQVTGRALRFCVVSLLHLNGFAYIIAKPSLI